MNEFPVTMEKMYLCPITKNEAWCNLIQRQRASMQATYRVTSKSEVASIERANEWWISCKYGTSERAQIWIADSQTDRQERRQQDGPTFIILLLFRLRDILSHVIELHG